MASESGKSLSVEDQSEELYAWIATIPVSKPKKNLTRDFSDAVLMAEVLKAYYPRYVDLHNYVPANSLNTKIENWNLLNRKVLNKIDMKLNRDAIQQLASSHPGAIEHLLSELRNKVLKDSREPQDPSCNIKDHELMEQEIGEEQNAAEITNEVNVTAELDPVDELTLQPTKSIFISTISRAKQRIFLTLKWLINWLFVWTYFLNFRKGRSVASAEQVQLTNANDDAENSVPQHLCAQMTQELREKNEIICNLNHKVTYLESSMKLKDLRISNLRLQLLENFCDKTEDSTKVKLNDGTQPKSRPRSQNLVREKSSLEE